MRRLAMILLALAGLAACTRGDSATWPAHPTTTAEMVAADISARDKALADDVFEGRAPGTASGEAAAGWIADELKRLGIKPGNGDSYFQDVPAVTIKLDPATSHLGFATPKGELASKFPDDVVFWTGRYALSVSNVIASPVVFVGYGVVAPEYGWNDYAGIDVKGKTVVILINDPGNEAATHDDTLFKGRAMTYYGRWTYKFEEAARQGAAAAIIVHETKPAAYGWQVVRNSNGADKMWLETADKNASRVGIEGWMTLETAQTLFARSRLDYATLKAAANKPGFKAVAVNGASMTATAHSSITPIKTRNVVGLIPGAARPEEVVIYSAHWDHLGRKDNLPGDDKIYNGAIDNALGVANVLEIAEQFAHGPPPARSLAFAFWTLEEQGLLGSEYFSVHPLWPRKDIVGVINLDGGSPRGPARELAASGTNQSEMEDLLKAALAKEGRTLAPDPEPERGSFYRSDHFPLAKVGIPAISPGPGRDLLEGGVEAGKKITDDYVANLYHQPSDEWRADWDLSGTVRDLQVYFAAGEALANSSQWPTYYPQSEFRAARDKDQEQLMRWMAAMVLALGLSACATNPYPGEPASAHDQERTDEAIFIATIDAGRMGIFVDRINSAAELMEAPALGGDELIGVMRSVRLTALEFLVAKEKLCKDGKFIEQSCTQVTPPRWLAEDPSARVTIAQVNARIAQVQIMMGPLMDVACEYGKAKSGDGMFCSVE